MSTLGTRLSTKSLDAMMQARNNAIERGYNRTMAKPLATIERAKGYLASRPSPSMPDALQILTVAWFNVLKSRPRSARA